MSLPPSERDATRVVVIPIATEVNADVGAVVAGGAASASGATASDLEVGTSLSAASTKTPDVMMSSGEDPSRSAGDTAMPIGASGESAGESGESAPAAQEPSIPQDSTISTVGEVLSAMEANTADNDEANNDPANNDGANNDPAEDVEAGVEENVGSQDSPPSGEDVAPPLSAEQYAALEPFLRMAQAQVMQARADTERWKADAERRVVELERKDREIAQWREDYERLRNALPKRVEDAVRRKREESVQGLIDLCDGLDRAMEMFARPPAEPHTAAFADRVRGGLESLRQQLLKHLESEGLTPIDAQGQPFDPRFHEAVGTVPADLPPGTVAVVARRGFRMGDHVTRPATVLVAGGGSG